MGSLLSHPTDCICAECRRWNQASGGGPKNLSERAKLIHYDTSQLEGCLANFETRLLEARNLDVVKHSQHRQSAINEHLVRIAHMKKNIEEIRNYYGDNSQIIQLETLMCSFPNGQLH
jgi:hypothetical protein